MFKKLLATVALTSSVLFSTSSTAYFGETFVNGAYDMGTKTIRYVKETPIKTVASYFSENLVNKAYDAGTKTINYVKENPIKVAAAFAVFGVVSYGTYWYKETQEIRAIDQCITPKISKFLSRWEEALICLKSSSCDAAAFETAEDKNIHPGTNFFKNSDCQKVLTDEKLFIRAINSGKIPLSIVRYIIENVR